MRQYTGDRSCRLEPSERLEYREGHLFYRSDNGVWLTDRVPAEYLEFD